MNEKKLIVGGSFQGKLNFVCEQLQYSKNQVVCSEEYIEKGMQNRSVLYGFHRIMQCWLEDGKSPEDLVEILLKDENLQVIISDEVGRGVVPLEKDERYSREQIGRALCKIASSVDQVYRIQCGLATKIKG